MVDEAVKKVSLWMQIFFVYLRVDLVLIVVAVVVVVVDELAVHGLVW